MRSLLIVSLSLLVALAYGQKFPTVQLGDQLPSANTIVTSTEGEKAAFATHVKENGLLVIFSCNTCPYVVAWEDRYNELFDYCEANNVGMVLVNSNAAKHDGVDAMEEMVKHAEEQQYKADYVLDEGSKVANDFGAKSTPHVFLFGADQSLKYKGAIDDSQKKAKVTKTYLKDAIGQMVAGEKIEINETKSVGCSIKRTS